ncbi:MAG: dipeptidase [Acidobacteriota bacterium]
MLADTQYQKNALLAIDLHADTLQRVLDEGHDLAQTPAQGHLDIARMRAGGLGAQFFSIWVSPSLYPGDCAVERAWRLIAALKQQVARHDDKLELATSPHDIERILQAGRIAASMGIEGGHAINGRLELVEEFYRAGVRYMTLSWSNSNEICGSSGDAGRERGLSDFGLEVVKLMNQLGMMVDVSHVSDRAFYDVLAVTTKPVIASHSNLRRLCNHPRNLTDDMLRALAQNGGICGINFYPVFLDDNYYGDYRDLSTELTAEISRAHADNAQDPVRAAIIADKIRIMAMAKLSPVTYKKVVDHIEQVVEIAGIDHVCLGSDFDGIPSVPYGLEDVSKLPIIANELAQRGYDSVSIEKIFSRNIMRVFAAVVDERS